MLHENKLLRNCAGCNEVTFALRIMKCVRATYQSQNCTVVLGERSGAKGNKLGSAHRMPVF
jgi:hypothetical protein